jgi:hypothetical protein
VELAVITPMLIGFQIETALFVLFGNEAAWSQPR